MPFITKTFYTQDDLARHLKTHQASFFFSSKTSTVIPYDKITELLPWDKKDDFFLCDLSKLPSHMELTPAGHLILRGGVSWADARDFLKAHGRNLKTSPTEQLALVTAGVATSCTGERCFAFGNMRSQVVRIKYLDFNGEEKELFSHQDLVTHSPHLSQYQADFKFFETFKNAPYPRFEKATDLMIGTEGQLGVITEVEIETTADDPVQYVFLLLPRWEDDFAPHLEIFHKVQGQRKEIISCELLDSNCMNYLKSEERLGHNQDIIFLEIKAEFFEEIYQNVLGSLNHIGEDQIFEITEGKFHHIRASVPRAIFEENSKMGVVKVGTDVQVGRDRFADLLNFYRECSKIGVRYCLFGHFGDAHLHYNYMPKQDETPKCLAEFQKLYDQVLIWKGSPFAEHGIGLIKQKYIKKFHGSHQLELFWDLKKEHDPFNQFFPQGFMSARP